MLHKNEVSGNAENFLLINFPTSGADAPAYIPRNLFLFCRVPVEAVV